MSINKFLNTWITNDTSIPGGYSFRNDGVSLFSGLLDVSGDMIYESTSNIRNKNIQLVNLVSASTTMDYLHNGRTYMITNPDPTGTNVLFLPTVLTLSTAMKYSVINMSNTYAVKIVCNPAQSSHRVYPANVQTATFGNGNTTQYILQPRQSVEIESDYASGWYFREGVKNNAENTWNKVSRFNASVGVNKAPAYTLDVSGDINFTGNLLLNGSTYAPAPGSNILGLNNTWTGTNLFNDAVVVKDAAYVDKNLTNILEGIDTDGGVLTFSSNTQFNGVNQINGITTVNDAYDQPKNLTNILTGIDTNVGVDGYVVSFNTDFNSALTCNNALNSTATFTNSGTYVSTGTQVINGYRNITTSRTLMPEDSGKVLVFTGALLSIILPEINVNPPSSNGLWYYLVGDDTNTVLINCGAGQYIQNYGGNVSSFTLKPRTTVFIGCNFNAVSPWWYVMTSSLSSVEEIVGKSNTWGGVQEFASPPTITGGTITSSTQVITKGYADANYGSAVGTVLLAGSNVFTGTNTFNTNLPTSTLTPTSSTQLTTKSYVDTAALSLQGLSNTWTGTNAFNGTSFGTYPTYSGAGSISAGNQFITKAYADSNYGSAVGIVSLAGNNTFTGQNIFNGSASSFAVFPTYTGAGIPSLPQHFATKNYVDGAIAAGSGSALLSSDNAWTGLNSFESQLAVQYGGYYENLGTQYNSSYISITSNTTLTTAQSGTQIILSGASALTITLPDLSLQVHGLWYQITGDSSFDSTIRTLTDSILRSSSSFTLRVNETVWLYANNQSASPFWVATKASMTPADQLLSSNNAWIGTNTFNTSLPTSTLTPSSSTQLITKAYADGAFVGLAGNQTVGGTKTFSTRISGSITQAYVQGSTGLSAQRLVMAATIGADNSLRASSTLTYDAPTDTLNATTVSLQSLKFNNADSAIKIGTNSGYATGGVSIGVGAGQNLNTTSQSSVAIGLNAFRSCTSYSNGDIAIGERALELYVNGGGNNAIGQYSMLNLVYGTSNTGIGAAAGGGLVGSAASPCNFNFAMGDSCMSNPYLAIVANAQYTGANTTSATYTLVGTSGTVLPGQYVVLYGGGTPSRVDVQTFNISTNVMTISASSPMDQNVYFYFYTPGEQQSGTYSGSTATGTSFTISTGMTISAGYRFSYQSSATVRGFTTVNSYNSGTGAIVLASSITLFGSTTVYLFNMDIAANQGLGFTDNVSVGKYSGSNISSFNQGNTSFGVGALNGQGGTYDNITYLGGSNNTACGFYSGTTLTGQSNNCTFLGAYADVVDRRYNKISNSCAIGYNSKVSRSSQIVLGTETETTEIPGVFAPQTIDMDLNDTTVYSAAPVVISTNTTLTTAQSGRYVVASSGAITITLPTDPPVGTNYKIISLSTSQVSITAGGTNTFSQNNFSTITIRLAQNGFQSVEIFYSGGVWYIVGGLYDVLRATKPSFISNTLGMGNANTPSHLMFGVSPTTITATTTLTTPTYGTHLVSSAANATITLPVILLTMVGQRILFRKTGTLASVISVAAGTANTIYIQNNITTVAAGVATQIISGTQSYGEIQCITTTSWAIL